MFACIVSGLKGVDLKIGVTEDGILFETEKASRSVLCQTLNTKSNNNIVMFNMNKPMKMTVGLIQAQLFTAAATIASSMNLILNPERPMVIEYNIDGLEDGKITYYLAPRVGDVYSSRTDLTEDEILELSAKLRTGRNVTTSEIKREVAKRSPVKRKRPTLSGSKSASLLTRPKRCSECKNITPHGEFFSSQLIKARGKCINCTVTGCRMRMVTYNEPRTWLSGEAEVARKRVEVRCLRSLGCERYECPKFFFEKKHNLSEVLRVSFARTLPNLNVLFGLYDVVYTYSESGPQYDQVFKQRTARGELLLMSIGTSDVTHVGLRGVVTMSPIISEYVEPNGGDFSFILSNDVTCHDFELPITVSGHPSFADGIRSSRQSTGTMRLLAERIATGWNPKENPREDPWHEPWDYKRVVQFDSVDESQLLVERWEELWRANSWLCSHMLLPAELAMKIHEYVAFRPPPAFFFEKGDLWISINWINVDRSALRTILVARRRSQNKL